MKYAPQKRRELFAACINERHLLAGQPAPEHVEELYTQTRKSPGTEWVDAYENKDSYLPIGFLLLGYPPECPFAAEVYIKDAYIDPAFRGQGKMTSLVLSVLQNVTGNVCLATGNLCEESDRFWTNLLSKAGYEPLTTSDEGQTNRCYRRANRGAV